MDIMIFRVLTLVTIVVLSFDPSSARIKISDDVFFGYGGRITQQLNTGHGNSTTKNTLTRPSSLRRLEILANDELIEDNNGETGTTPCKLHGNHGSDRGTEEVPENQTIHFKEIAKVRKIFFIFLFKSRLGDIFVFLVLYVQI